MRRRIAIAIFMTVFATLVACGTIVFFAARSVLLANLDDSLVQRAAARPEMVDETGQHSEADHPLDPGDRYVIRSADDNRILYSPTKSHEEAGAAQIERIGDGEFSQRADGVVMRTVKIRGFARVPGAMESVPVVLSFSGGTEDYFSMLRELTQVLIAGGLIGCIGAAAVAWSVSGAALRPLRDTTAVIGKIDEANLHHRIDEKNLPVELLPVAQTLNMMLESLEQGVKGRKQFLADAAHELRTPVAAMMTGLEVTLRRPRETAAYKAALESCLTDARYMRRLVGALMNQARGELSNEAHPNELFDATQLVRDCVNLAQPLADKQAVLLETSLQPEMFARSAPDRWRAVLINLISNAIDHNPAGGSVKITLVSQDRDIVISIKDCGNGIAPEHLPHIFHPFYRADSSRRADDHLGLGLFLVQTHCRAMGGNCSVQSEVAVGTTFTVRIPACVETKPPSEKSARSANIPATHLLLMTTLVHCALKAWPAALSGANWL